MGSIEQRRATSIRWLILLLFLAALTTLAFSTYIYYQTEPWQVLGGMINAGVLLILLTAAYVSFRRDRLDTAGYLVLAVALIGYIGAELFVSGLTIPLTVGGTLFILLVGRLVLPRRWLTWLLTVLVYGGIVTLLNWFEPLSRYPADQTPLVQSFLIGLIAVMGLGILWQSIRAYQRIATIRNRLLVAFVAVVLVPLIVLALVAGLVSYRSAQRGITNQLESVAALKEAEIQNWVDNLQTDLAMLIGEPQMLRRMNLLAQATRPSEYEVYTRVIERFQKNIESAERFEELFLMNTNGRVVASTNPRQEDQIYSYRTFFQRGLEGPYVHPPFYSPAMRRWSVIVARPIIDEDGQLRGVLAGRASLDALNEIMAERAGLGETGETYLVDLDYTMFTESRFAEGGIYVLTEGANKALQENVNGAALYEDYRDVPVVGVYHWLPELRVALMAEQDQSEALRGTYVSLVVIGGLAVVAVLAAVFVALRVTESIASPLAGLADTATQIAAGDLDRTAEIERDDEIGALANAFNSMTAQLRDFIASLEERVAERTRELQQRSAYLEASAQVGRAASSILETDRLIEEAVELIRQRFDLYYVGLFLLDEPGQWAILRAGTGEAGRKMLSRGHRIRVGEGMIGWSVSHGEPRVALEAGEDAVRLATAELPETRSEAALPLQSRGQILGALTVQSTQVGAFDPDTLVVLETMADQVAVALDNAQLFAESQAALEAARRAYGELSREAWSELLHTRQRLGFLRSEHGIVSASHVERPHMKAALRSGRTVVSGDGGRTVATPIKVRGESVAVIEACKPKGEGGWSPEETALVETLAEQLSVALESARLYEGAQRRAAREQLAGEIASRMRETLDIDQLLQTAIREIGERLDITEVEVRMGPRNDRQGSK